MNYHISDALSSLRPKAEWTVVGNDLNGITWHDKGQSQPTSSEIDAEITRLTDAEPMRVLRVERNKRLDETDWWILKGNASDDQLAYRQSLRDLPANTQDASNPTWPTEP